MKHKYRTRKRQKMDSNASEARGWIAFSLLWWHRICVEKIKIQYFWDIYKVLYIKSSTMSKGKKDLPIMN